MQCEINALVFKLVVHVSEVHVQVYNKSIGTCKEKKHNTDSSLCY